MIIYALGIHSGGGKVLLDHILSVKDFGQISTIICDSRYSPPLNITPDLNIIKVAPHLISRWKAEYKLKRISSLNPFEEILCFSSMPPAFELYGKTILFFQNALLLPKVTAPLDSFKTKLRIAYEKLWIYLFLSHVSEIWVQTNWMRDNFVKTTIPIRVKPFIPSFPTPTYFKHKKYDFITVTGNASHKMLNELLEEWDEFSINQPSLLIITDLPNEKIKKTISNLKNKNIFFAFNVPREEVFNYYQQSKALLVTSQIESFCLPIYEANHFHLKIYTLNRGYSNEAPINGHIEAPGSAKFQETILKINELI